MVHAPNDPLEGVLLIDKPSGCTSHDVVARIRRILSIKKVGHAGTLDPIATGLLIILVGKATKISQYLMSLNKTYEGDFLLGQATNSHDCEGDVTATAEVPELTEESMRAHMAHFIGDQYQTPPMFSAKKVNGVPLYKMARQGKEIEREPRFINISDFDLLSFNESVGSFRLACSKGTYVRTAVHDLGQKIGCGAHLTRLRRTHIDRFTLEQAITLEALEEMGNAQRRRELIPIYQAVPSHVL